MASFTAAFRPWIKDTTAMIDVTATMFPRTVISERRLALQIAASAMPADSRNLFMRLRRVSRAALAPRSSRAGVLDPGCVALDHRANGVVGPGDALVAGLQAGNHLKV